LRTLLLERRSGKFVSNDEMIDAISGAATHKRAKHGI
jgi:hypothetical protein